MPNSWNNALVLLFAKPVQNPANAQNYRPVVSTSCMCKWRGKGLFID